MNWMFMNNGKNTALLIIDVQIGSLVKEKLIYKGDELNERQRLPIGSLYLIRRLQ